MCRRLQSATNIGGNIRRELRAYALEEIFMKRKLSMILALAAVLTALVACSEQEPEKTTTTTTTVTTTTTTTTTVDPNPGPVTPGTDDPTPGDDPVSTPIEIALDGNLTDWKNVKSISVIGSGDFQGKKATFYAVKLEDGLYLACDAYHNVYKTDQNDWWKNTNFEFFIGNDSNDQYWVSAKGMSDTNTECQKSDNVTTAVMVTSENEEEGATYHTVTEAFVANEKIQAKELYADGSLRVGVAWKTEGDDCNNTGHNAVDNWWTPIGAKTNDLNSGLRPYVNGKGIYTAAEYRAEAGTEFVKTGSEWSFLTATGDATAAPEGWNTAAISTWEKANAPFGNRAPGSTNAWGTTDNPNNGTQNKAYLWVAQTFTVTDLNALDGLKLYVTMFYDDTITLYINGTQVYAHLDGNAWNDGYAVYKLADNAKEALREGTNVIAASLHQHSGGYEFDLSLYASNADAFIPKK